MRTSTGTLEVRGASTHNLKDVDVDIPLGVLVVVTRVVGSGKSSLIGGSVSGRDGVVTVDQAPIRGSRRSNPATYTGLLDPIRNAFAKANGVKPALFSANSDGACPGCNGAGVICKDLAMMAGFATVCEEYGGQALRRVGARISARRPRHQRGARDIGRPRPASSSPLVLATQGAGRERDPRPARRRRARVPHDRTAAHDAVRGRAPSGQARHPHRRERRRLRPRRTDERLRLAYVEQLLGLLDRLVDSGKSVIVIEHHQAVMAHADWIIDLGPGAGHDGGRVMFEGTPADLVAGRAGIPSLTGEHLADYVRA